MKKVWLVSVNMGYGHQRAIEPIKDLAIKGKIIQANNYQGIPQKDRKIWQKTRRFYEFISRFRKFPLLGQLVFSFFDAFQNISGFYPKRDLTKSNFSLNQIYSLFKKAWGKDLIEKLKKKPCPLLTTFFIPAFMAEFFNYPKDIFCVVCDTDIARTWAPLNPKLSKIKYLTPTERVVERLKLYGVKKENIFLTGYPLPQEIIGAKKMEILKKDLKERLLNLDPKKRYFQYYEPLIKKHLGNLPKKSNRVLTIMFSVGGAGAQKKLGIKIMKSLAKKIKANKVKLILSAGIRKEVKEYFERKIKGKGVEILYKEKIQDYFKAFNQALRKTDILYTKPSELSFYSGLGLPIIIAPCIGSQEEFNKRWLLKSGFGILQKNPDYINQWLFDWLDQGYLAEAAMQGFIEGKKMGVFNIKKIISKCPGF
ncbi:hypothetical protein KAU40_02700 [Candidatus Parcubacteria bacterium]|nr:hypothetical protein [Candidatus Parcubacteria bacterium]